MTILKARAVRGSLLSARRSSWTPPGADALHRRDFIGRGEIVNDGVEEALDADILEGAAAEDGGELVVDGAAADRLADFVLGEFVALDVGDHDLLVEFGDTFDHGFAPAAGVGDVLFGDVAFDGGGVAVGAEEPGAHPDQVNDAFETVFGADRDLDGDGNSAEAGRGSFPSCASSRRPMRSILLTKQMRGTW